MSKAFSAKCFRQSLFGIGSMWFRPERNDWGRKPKVKFMVCVKLNLELTHYFANFIRHLYGPVGYNSLK